MREIEFNYIYQHDETGRIIDKRYNIEDIENFEFNADIRGYSLIARRQCTGLLDKQGVEVYEGDIVEAMQEYELGEDKWYAIGEVEFYNGSFVFRYKIDGSWGLLTGLDEIEVIGNIYEHSYLLEENK